MKFGVNTFLWTPAFGTKDFALLGELRQRGFDGVEVSLIQPANFEAPDIRSAVTSHGLMCTVCSVLPRELNRISDDRAIRQKTRSHLAECVKLTAEAGANILAGPLYAPVAYLPGRRRTGDEWRRAVEAYQELGSLLENYRVHLCIEPLKRFDTYSLNTTDDAVRLCDGVINPLVGILWDSFHANIEEKKLPEALRLAGRHLKHVHACENDRGTPGTGHVDWAGIFVELSNLHYDGWLTIESFGFTLGDLSAAASIWRDLADTPERIAWDGVEFLKQECDRHLAKDTTSHAKT